MDRLNRLVLVWNRRANNSLFLSFTYIYFVYALNYLNKMKTAVCMSKAKLTRQKSCNDPFSSIESRIQCALCENLNVQRQRQQQRHINHVEAWTFGLVNKTATIFRLLLPYTHIHHVHDLHDHSIANNWNIINILHFVRKSHIYLLHNIVVFRLNCDDKRSE